VFCNWLQNPEDLHCELRSGEPYSWLSTPFQSVRELAKQPVLVKTNNGLNKRSKTQCFAKPFEMLSIFFS